MQPDIEYRLEYADGSRDRIPLHLAPVTHTLQVDEDFEPPAWALLASSQCSHCPLNEAEHRWCPVARNIAWLFAGVTTAHSWNAVRLEVVTPSRTVSSTTTMQRALSSLLGVACSLSDCPHTLPFRPMGVFHLPLSTDVETLVRASAFFLLKSYLDHLRDPGKQVDLTDMVTAYRNLNELNRGLVHRFRYASDSDAAVNAVVLLDLLAKDVKFELESHLGKLQSLFCFEPEALAQPGFLVGNG